MRKITRNKLIKKPIKKGSFIHCGHCSKLFYIYPSRLKTISKSGRKYCSRRCSNETNKTNTLLKCCICDKLFYRSISQVKYRKSKTCSLKCRRIYTGRTVSGKNNPCWKGGLSRRRKARYSIKLKNWRKKVFERDDYTCQKCGVRRVYLEAHHIKPFAIYPKSRCVIKNGTTLCRSCHNETKKTKS